MPLTLELPNASETLSPLGLPLPAGHQRMLVSHGTRGTAQTIEQMQKMVNSYKRNDEIRALVGSILNPKDGSRPCESKDYYCYAKACYQWCRDKIMYAYDPNGVEYIESPVRVIKNGIADCDSICMLLASMLEMIGLQTQFVTIKADASRPDEYSHVYMRVMIPKVGWVSCDPIMPKKWFGWEAPYPNGKRYWPGSSDQLEQKVDTSPSIEVGSDGAGLTGLDCVKCERPQRAMGSLGHRGHGRGRRGGWGWSGPAYGAYAYPFFDEYPMVIAPDQLVIVAPNDVTPQQEEVRNDLAKGMTGSGESFFSGLGAANLPESETRSWIEQIQSGGLAQTISSVRERNKKNLAANLSMKRQAQKLPSGANRDAVLSSINRAYDALINESQKIYTAVTAYNFAVDELKKQSAGLIAPNRINGLGAAILASVPVIFAVSGAIAALAISVAVMKSSNDTAVIEVTKSESEFKSKVLDMVQKKEITPQQGSEIIKGATSGASGGVLDWFTGSFKDVGPAAVKVAVVAGIGFLIWKSIGGLSGRATERHTIASSSMA